MLNQFSRTELLFGKEAMEKLAGSRVAVLELAGLVDTPWRHLFEAESVLLT